MFYKFYSDFLVFVKSVFSLISWSSVFSLVSWFSEVHVVLGEVLTSFYILGLLETTRGSQVDSLLETMFYICFN